jgi:hypothetical protein
MTAIYISLKGLYMVQEEHEECLSLLYHFYDPIPFLVGITWQFKFHLLFNSFTFYEKQVLCFCRSLSMNNQTKDPSLPSKQIQ